jgi:hypothetical protein
MKTTEWASMIVPRINGLWPPPMPSITVDAYFDVLAGLDVTEVRRAVELIARTDRDRRPPAGLILATATGHGELPPNALPPPRNADILTPEEHREVMADLERFQTPEHRRRVKAVLSLPRRLAVGQLAELLAVSRCEPDEFDRRLALIHRDMEISTR